MNLLLTSVGNSSLQRIVSSTAALQDDVKVIKGYISANNSLVVRTPSLSAVEDEVFKASLSAALMKNAEILQPWSTVGINSQMDLFAVSKPKEKVPLEAYANLVKSSWILIDIIACHPQVPFVTASTQLEVQSLSAEIKKEFARLSDLGLIIPNLGEIEIQDLSIWEVSTKAPDLRPRKPVGSKGEWTVASGEYVLFQRFAICKLPQNEKPLPCILLFLVQSNAKDARLVAQHQDGSTIMTLTFEQLMSYDVLGKCVTANDVKLYFSVIQDVEILGCMLEATNNYVHKRVSTASHADLDNLKALILLTAVKNLCNGAVERLLPLMISKGDFPGEGPEGSLPFVALSLASLHIKRELNQQLLDNDEHGINKRRSLSLLYWAIQCGHSTLVEVMAKEVSLECNRDIDTFSSTMTPLGLASYCGHENIVSIMLANGVDPNAANSDGNTPLHNASMKGHESVMKLLLANGADFTVANDVGCRPLDNASIKGHESVIKLLLDHGADVTAEARLGQTPFFLAASEGHEDAINVLLDHGAIIDTVERLEGCTAIMAAAKRGHYAAALCLIEKGANLLIPDRLGYDVRHLVMKYIYSYSKPDELIATIYDRACEIMRGSSPCPPLTLLRRAEITFSCDAAETNLWLCSHHAFIILTPDAPPDVEERYKRLLIIDNDDVTVLYSTWTFKFTVIHQEDTLEFAVETTRGVRGKAGAASLQVAGGGERSCSADAGKWLSFQKWPGVELDPDAEVVDPVELEGIDIPPGICLNRQVRF